MARPSSRPIWLYPLLISALVAFVVDQVTKWIVIRRMRLDIAGQIDALPPLVRFRYGENRGINFGLFNGYSEAMPWVLIGLSVVISIAVVLWVTRRHAKAIPMLVSAGFLVGGAMGNALDRVLYGYVLDFLNMSCCGFDNPYVFNIADVFIFAGAIGLALFEPRSGSRGRGRKKGA
ncbi:MAG: signal peptidase II [Rhodobacteraceae bacterium]|nr:signal peptidase II [Paracoccaceae bacterium]MAY45088.1 signal peptidase II [Paracoccaceae bacterium]QEW22575.1 Lipoprotein signal peptidase [Marinibacterium anthonyi]